MSNEDILTVIEQRHEDLKSLIEINAKLTNAEIGAVADMMKVGFQQVTARQDKANGSLGKHDKRLCEAEKTISPQTWARRNWKVAAVVFILGVYALHAIVESVRLSEISEVIKYIK
jgi:hypothetical protein